ncbi:MAG TPA: lamin tail domain-containing protein, partial [Clostridia bacterium]|nr:lamin tail domain-containing protein [Clostridia bacterium]
LGTPGQVNSRRVQNAPPAIYDMRHSPIVPASMEAVVVTACVHDPDQVNAVVLTYRVDPGTTTFNLDMRDDGTGGDAVAGDGLFSATLPGQSTGTVIAFYLQATDGFSTPATAHLPNDVAGREFVIRFGDNVPTGNLPVYRLWMTQATANTWSSRPKLDNTPNNVTFVLGEHRVIHNTLALFAGSPYISPGFTTPSGNRCGYSITFPSDDPFLGGEDLVLDWPGGHGNENTAIQEQMAYYILERMNLPFSYRHHIRLHVNGVTDMQRGGVFEAVMQPAGDFLDQWSYGDSDGDFYKIDRGFEFNDGGSVAAEPMPRLQNYITIDPDTGKVIKKTERYRWTWLKRSYDSALDYSGLMLLVDALNASSPEPYTSQTEALLDVDQVMGTFAFEHIINNFDSWGHEIGKNNYFYKPQQGRWQLYAFDLDWLMLVSVNRGSQYASGNGPLFLSEDPTVSRMYNHPPFLRAYLRAVHAAVNGPLLSSNCDPVMDAKYASLMANGVTMCDGFPLAGPATVKTWFQQRRTVLQTQLNALDAPFAVTGPTTVNVTSNLVTLSGTAPVHVDSILINGVPQPVTWTSLTNWTVRLPVIAGSSPLTITGTDSAGNVIPGLTRNIIVVFSGTVSPAAGAIVINEIMANPQVPDAEYVELFNNSSQTAFDLSGWIFNGVDFVFPAGSYLAPGKTWLLAKNRLAFSQAYGSHIVPDGEFPGNLQSGGETLTLLQPGTNEASGQVIAKVRYEGGLPWPDAVTNGSALQLLDPLQDNWRAGNWVAGSSNTFAPPQWVFFSTNFTATSSTLYLYLTAPGDIYIDDFKLARGAGANVLANGNFESPLAGSWNVTANFAQSTLSTLVKRSGNSSLHLVATASGSGSGNSIYQQISPALTLNQTYTLSFYYLQTTNSGALIARLSLSGNPGVVNPAPPRLGSLARSPGASNNLPGELAPFPSLWINELQPENLDGITNSAGQHAAWIELYNPGSNVISLEGLFLSVNYTNLLQWAFPAGATINPGQYKIVYADGQTQLSTLGELHTSFVLPPGSGSLALTRLANNVHQQVLDYVNYAGVRANRSYGSYPNGQSFDRQQLYYVTPASANNGTSAPLVAFINEWLADNVATLADPADNNYEDWFEIYNPGDTAIDLGGYYLTDNLTQPLQYMVPANGHYTLPPGGFLLVWADDEIDQNSTNRADLHVPFKLGKDGEAIGLFAADGTPVDFVTFGQQTTDRVQGRTPDGGAVITSLTPATPRMTNPAGNTAPVLGLISDRYVYLGETVQFTASATDAQVPPQTLSFSLDPGAPAGAAVHPVTGLFTWTPTEVQVPGTHSITLRVSDSGVPPLSATRTFSIVAQPLPAVRFVAVSGSTFLLAWTGLPGKLYRLQYQDELGAPTWVTAGADQWGNG